MLVDLVYDGLPQEDSEELTRSIYKKSQIIFSTKYSKCLIGLHESMKQLGIKECGKCGMELK